MGGVTTKTAQSGPTAETWTTPLPSWACHVSGAEPQLRPVPLANTLPPFSITLSRAAAAAPALVFAMSPLAKAACCRSCALATGTAAEEFEERRSAVFEGLPGVSCEAPFAARMSAAMRASDRCSLIRRRRSVVARSIVPPGQGMNIFSLQYCNQSTVCTSRGVLHCKGECYNILQ